MEPLQVDPKDRYPTYKAFVEKYAMPDDFQTGVCYAPVLIHEGVMGSIVAASVKKGRATEDQSKVTCTECLGYIHA